MARVRLSLTIDSDVAARLYATAEQMGLKPSILATRIIETADLNGDYDIARDIVFPCPFSSARLHELRFLQSKTLIEIGKLAQEVEQWETAPRPAQVRAWIETAGFTCGRDKLPVTRITGTTRAKVNVDPGYRQCPRCLEIKLLETEFYNDSSRPHGYSTYCKVCHGAKRSTANMRSWYQRNRDKHLARVKENKAKRKAEG